MVSDGTIDACFRSMALCLILLLYLRMLAVIRTR